MKKTYFFVKKVRIIIVVQHACRSESVGGREEGGKHDEGF